MVPTLPYTLVSVYIKICGITCEEDALLAVAMGADALGFMFAPSTRRVTPARARDIAARLPNHIMTVGVFRDEARGRVVDVVHTAGLNAVQLHGHEGPEDSMWVSERVPFLIKAFVAGDADIERPAAFGASAIHIEGTEPGKGQVFDWSILDTKTTTRVILAGGLDPTNVASAIAQVKPWGVDVSTGVESGPGRKDPAKVRQFITAATAAFEALPAPDRFRGDGVGGDDLVYDWRDEPGGV